MSVFGSEELEKRIRLMYYMKLEMPFSTDKQIEDRERFGESIWCVAMAYGLNAVEAQNYCFEQYKIIWAEHVAERKEQKMRKECGLCL